MQTPAAATAATALRFMKHYVTDGTTKARVHYSHTALIGGQKVVTLYAKTFDDGRALAQLLGETYENNTDICSDYFEKGRARIAPASTHYEAALARC